jgi:pyruvate formate lyase activating enzyme
VNFKFSSIIDFSEDAWPGKTASVVYLAGCPLQCFWCNVPFLVNAQEGSFDSKPTDFFISHFAKLQATVDGIVFMGGEPLMQGNALISSCKQLKAMGFALRTETSGYYPQDLMDLLPLLDYVALDVKSPLEEEAYANATSFAGDGKILLSKILSSLAFLEADKRVFKEIRTTVIPGLNDSVESIEKICSQVSFADLYALQQLKPGKKGDFVDANYECSEAPPKEKMYELAYAAKKTFKEVLVRFNDGSEELI